MDKRKVIKIFEEVLDKYDESETDVIHERSSNIGKELKELSDYIIKTRKEFYDALKVER